MLEANGFTNYSSFLHTSFDESLESDFVERIRQLKQGDKYYKILSDCYDEPLTDFKLLLGWKSSLRSTFITMNECDPNVFEKLLEIRPEEQKQQPLIVQTATQNISKLMKQKEEDPLFLTQLIKKFQAKIFTKLKELDPTIAWADPKSVPISFVCDLDCGKKFEIKCPYCSSSLVIYWRYQQPAGSTKSDTYYANFSDSYYFKHLAKHISGSRLTNHKSLVSLIIIQTLTFL